VTTKNPMSGEVRAQTQANVEGPLKAYAGQKPPAPGWFDEAVAQPYETHRIEVEGAEVEYLRWGDRTKPGLLFCHGNGAHAYWWSFIAPFLANQYNVAALTFSGMGDSGTREQYSLDIFSKEQLAVMDHSGMNDVGEPPIIVAHSFGGFVTMLTGALYGDRLAGTVIVDSPVNPPGRHGGPPNRLIRPHKIYPTLNDALARFRLAPEQTCDNHYLIDYVGRRSIKQVEGGFTWKFDPLIWQRFSIGDPAERLRETKCRIGIFRGEFSAIFPPDVGDYMFEILGRNVPVVEIPQARHHLILDQPIAFVAALRALLADWDHSRPHRSVD